MTTTTQSSETAERSLGGVPIVGWDAGMAVGTYKVDRDRSGDWWVWRRLSARTWVTHVRCADEAKALELAERLNEESPV